MTSIAEVTSVTSSSGYSLALKTVSDLPKSCIEVAQLLLTQPIVITDELLDDRFLYIRKTMDFNITDASIIALFNCLAMDEIGVTYARSVSKDGKGAMVSVCRDTAKGVHVWEKEGCSLDTLQKTYEEMLKRITQGWMKARPEDYPDMCTKKDSKEFCFFVKKVDAACVPELIRFLALKLLIGTDVSADNAFKKGKKTHYAEVAYMWIRESQLKEVVAKFGFELK